MIDPTTMPAMAPPDRPPLWPSEDEDGEVVPAATPLGVADGLPEVGELVGVEVNKLANEENTGKVTPLHRP